VNAGTVRLNWVARKSSQRQNDHARSLRSGVRPRADEMASRRHGGVAPRHALRHPIGQRLSRHQVGDEEAAVVVRRIAPGENPITRLNVRLKAASDS
jgi:hypothetical protein